MASALGSAQFAPGSTHTYRVVTTQTEFEGTGSKVTAQSVTETPVSIRVVDARNLEVTSGPLFTRGRSVGRARVANVSVGGAKLPSWFFVPVPAGGLKTGQKWAGPLFAPAPIPAGLTGSYAYRSVANGVALLNVSVKQLSSTTDMKAAGNLGIDAKTGVPKQGKIVFQISYLRPDMKDRSKMVVNSHMTVECVIQPK